MARGLAACLIAALFSVAVAAAPSFLNEPTQQGAPGSYLTLAFRVTGEGEATFRVVAPEGWLPVSGVRTLSLRGDASLPVTLRVPPRALADTRADVSIEAVQDGRVVAVGRGLAVVAAVAGLSLDAPASLEAAMDAVLLIPVRVHNLGNQSDSVRLDAETASWIATVSPSTLELPPFGSATVEVALAPAGRFNDGYRYQVTVVARSTVDPDLRRSARVTAVFRDPGAQRRESPDPQLTMRVDAGAVGRLTVADGEATTRLDYRASASLRGELSDFVSVTILPDALSGDLDGLRLPSSTSVALQAETWDAALSVAPGRVSAGTGFEAGDWRWSVGGTYAGGAAGANWGLDLATVSQRDGLDLQAYGQASLSGAGHAQALSVLYRLPLDDGLALDLALGVAGGDRNEVGTYRLVPSLTQGLSWVSQGFDVRQTLTAIPTLGRYTLGLAGGTRSLGDWSVRANTRLTLQPDGSRWFSTAQWLAAPSPGLTVGVSAAINTSDFGARDTWLSVSPNAAYTHRFDGGLQSRFGVTYTRRQGLSDDVPSSHRVQVGVGNAFGSFGMGASVEFEVREPGWEPFERLAVRLSGSYRPTARAALDANYTDRRTIEEDVTRERVLGVRWAHVWNPKVTSSVAYARRATTVGDGSREASDRLSLDLGVADAWVDGLRLRFSYALSATGGLFQPDTAYAHDVALGVSYPIRVDFDTPAEVTAWFGGRATGRVTGVAFVDRDLDGVYGAGDEPLTGLTVVLGGVSAVTDESGTYELRVPEGAHAFGFDGLPATLSLLEEASQQVVVNEEAARDLPFAEVVALSVTLFDDLDRDGVQGDGEPGIAFGGVVVEGPVTRAVRLDGDGHAIVGGLPAGRYTVRVDSTRVPAGYRATGETVVVTVRPPQRPAPVRLGAALPERNVVTTFRPGGLSVFAWSRDSTRPAGSEMLVEARVQGDPEQVSLQLLGRSVPLQQVGDAWQVTFRLPLDAPPGLARGVVRAVRGDGRTEAAIQVLVTDQPSYRHSIDGRQAGTVVTFGLRTLFRAGRVEVAFAEEAPVTLFSDDGYAWAGDLRLPGRAGEHALSLVVDGEPFGVIAVEVDEASSP